MLTFLIQENLLNLLFSSSWIRGWITSHEKGEKIHCVGLISWPHPSHLNYKAPDQQGNRLKGCPKAGVEIGVMVGIGVGETSGWSKMCVRAMLSSISAYMHWTLQSTARLLSCLKHHKATAIHVSPFLSNNLQSL